MPTARRAAPVVLTFGEAGHIPCFGKAWRRVKQRIRVYLNREHYFFHVRLAGPYNMELLDLTIRPLSVTHQPFYKYFLKYLADNFRSVDRSDLSSRELKDFEDCLLGHSALCMAEPLPLPESVVRELFMNLEAKHVSRDLEKKQLDEEVERLLKERERLDEQLSCAKRRRANLEGQYYCSDSN